jgi:endonuclease YncB( thermonuclease family)
LLLVILVFCALSACHRQEKFFTAKCVGVVDGDTLVVLQGRKQIRVRIWGIDAPEGGQPFGRNAKLFMSELVFGKQVVVYPSDVDQYGRTVARVYSGDTDIGLAAVSAGYAWWFTRHSPRDEELRNAQAEARNAGRGLWARPGNIPPWEYRSDKHRGTERL